MSREDEDQVDGNLKVRCKKLSLCSTFLQFNFFPYWIKYLLQLYTKLKFR